MWSDKTVYSLPDSECTISMRHLFKTCHSCILIFWTRPKMNSQPTEGLGTVISWGRHFGLSHSLVDRFLSGPRHVSVLRRRNSMTPSSLRSLQGCGARRVSWRWKSVPGLPGGGVPPSFASFASFVCSGTRSSPRTNGMHTANYLGWKFCYIPDMLS